MHLPRIVFSYSTTFFLIAVALVQFFGSIMYVLATQSADFVHSGNGKYRIYMVQILASILDLIAVFILDRLYQKLAKYLTDFEFPRTEEDYNNSLSLKLYIFQFFNFYSSIFYIALIKGKLTGYPYKYNRIFGYRQEECDPGGCFMELTIQLTIQLIGFQLIGLLLSLFDLYVIKYFGKGVTRRMTLREKLQIARLNIKRLRRISRRNDTEQQQNETIINKDERGLDDYYLENVKEDFIFWEYLEIVKQYGFVTIFVTAFPLAPVFALFYNLINMRITAKKYVYYSKRPVPERARDIQVWTRIIPIIIRISIFINALIIALSSQFLPKLVHYFKGGSESFLDFTSAVFNTSDFEPGSAPAHSEFGNVTLCSFSEYRNSYNEEPKYKRPWIYWYIVVFKLGFIIVYQNFMTVLTGVIGYIPDVPLQIKLARKHEKSEILKYMTTTRE